MDTDYWRFSFTDYTADVNEKTARDVIRQYEEGVKVLKFFDLYGGETLIPAKDFRGVWHSNQETRQASEDFQAALKQEAAPNVSWD